MKILATLTLAALLSGCSTYMPQRYSASADNVVVIKALNVNGVNVGTFTTTVKVDSACRGAGPIAPPDSMSFEAYIQKAFADELKLAGVFDAVAPKVTLAGVLTKIDFSSSKGLTGGEWNLALDLKSSNGKSISATETYNFNSGFGADTACKQTAEAFLPATQNLLAKLIKNPNFKAMLQ
ncbi:hypothetical protein [Limnohabitans sp. Rim8]|uniref:hypothetical protein n=1 Tax=Limnohabitans sp. Rim8 TaxID=1100718 RepID=UPI0025E65877|nr:hypothetical protein [Limnohabitans sp. Rim8]